MTTPRTLLPAALGFAFVAVAFGQGFWIAVACLLGALVFHVAHGLWRGDLTLSELQERAEAARSGFARAASPDTDASGPSGRVS
jgi:hypothetical protein